MVEIATAAVYYYTWDRVDAKTHQHLAGFTPGLVLCTLVIINGILTFMLTPGQCWLAVAGTGREAIALLASLLQSDLLAQPGSALAGLLVPWPAVWALITASRIEPQTCTEGRSAPLVHALADPSFVLMPMALLWYLSAVPENSRHLMQAGVSTIGSGLFTQVTRAVLMTGMTSATILAIVYFLGLAQSRRISNLGHAVSVLFLALCRHGRHRTRAGDDPQTLHRGPVYVFRTGCAGRKWPP